MKRSILEEGTKSRMRVLKGVGTLFLLVLDLLSKIWAPASSSCSLKILVRRLTQKLCRVKQDLRAIVIEGFNVILLNKLANPLGMKLLKF